MEQVRRDHVDRLGDPIAFGQALRERLKDRFVKAELRRDRVLFARDARFAPLLLVTAPQHLFGGVEQLGEDRKSVVEGKDVAVRVDLGGWRVIKKKNHKT